MPIDFTPSNEKSKSKIAFTPAKPAIQFEPEAGDGLGEELVKGVQRAVAPQTLTAKELKDASIPEIAAQVGTEIASGVAAGAIGAKIGAGIGTLVAPGPGTAAGAAIGSALGAGAWGLYKGIVSEEAAAKASGRDFNPFNAALSVGVELNPLSKGTKLARAGRQAALQAGEAYAQTGDPTVVAAAGAIGGGLVGLTPAKQRWFENVHGSLTVPTKANPTGRLTGKDIAQKLEFLEDNSGQLLARAQKRIDAEDLSMPESVKNLVRTGERSTPEDDEFVRWLLMRPGMDVKDVEAASRSISEADVTHFTKLADTLSDDALEQSYRRFREGQIMTEEAVNVAEELGTAVSGHPDPMKTGFLKKWLKDPLFVGREVDNVLGTNLEGSTAAFSQARNAFSVTSGQFLNKAKKLTDLGRKLKVDPKAVGRALDGQADLEGEAGELVKQWRQLFDDVQEYQNTHGMKVGYLDNYFPQMSKSPGEFVAVMKLKLRDLVSKYGKQQLDEIPEAEDFVRSLKFLKAPGANPNEVTIVNREIPALINRLEEPEYHKKFLGFEGSAAFQRTGDMPDFLREYDVGQAFQRYINGNLKPIFFRSAFEQTANNVAALRGAGFFDTANYFNDYLKAMSGEPSTFAAWIDTAANKMRANAIIKHADAQGPMAKYGAKVQQFLPDFVAWNASLIYPNMLGYNLHAPLRNMTQTWLVTAPEVGGAYGYNATRRGWQSALKSLRKLPRPTQTDDMVGERQIKSVLRLDKMEQFLQEKGLAPGKFFGEGASIVGDSMRNVPGMGRAVSAVDTLGDFGMTLYGGSDVANRYITYHIGKTLAKDFLDGKEGARKFMDSLSGGAKAAVRRAATEEELGDILGSYLISKTQFNYGREGLNKFGREYGRVVSMFSKWPVMIWSDIAELHKQGRNAAILQKYITPLAVLAAGDMALEEIDATKNPAGKLLLGQGLKSASPVNSVIGIDVPPLVKLPLKGAEIAKKLVDGDVKKAGRTLQKTLAPFAPLGFVPVATQRVKKAFE